MNNQELQQYQQRYNFIIDPEGRFARPETGNIYFFDDHEFNTKYIGRVTNTGNRGITLILQEYVPDITIGEVINKRINLVGRSHGRELLPDSIVHLDNDSLDLVDAYLIPTNNNNNNTDTSSVGYISNTEDEDDEFAEELNRLTLGKRESTTNGKNISKRSRQQGGKKSKKRKSRKVKRRSKKRKTNRRRY